MRIDDRQATTSRDESDESVGRHVLADMRGIGAETLRDEQRLWRTLRDALESAGFRLLDQLSYKFPGAESGVTAIALLSESHASIHTYPEYEYLAVDVFSCGQPDPQAVIKFLTDAFQPQTVEVSEHIRGRGAK